MNWALLENSLLVAGLTTLASVGLGFVVALFLAGLRRRWQKVFLAGALVSLALPPFVVTNCWMHFLGHGGAWRHWFPINLYSLGGAIWVLTLMTWPITLLLVLSDWQKIESVLGK